MFEIVLIAPEPLCPSSDLLRRRVEEMAALNYEDEGMVLRLTSCDNVKVCTPEKVAELAGLDSNRKLIEKLLNRRRENFGAACRAADLWCPELEELRRPLQEAAEDLSLLMTPVLTINGRIRSHGKVPNPCELDQWLKEASL